MNLPSIFKLLVNDPDVVNVLGWPFDFEVCEPYLLSSDWPISLSEELVVLAEDGSGGAYTILENLDPDKSPVIFLSSEGQAGSVAANLTEFLSLLVALPYWRDLLKFSSGGQLNEMKKAAIFLQAEILEDEPKIKNKMKVISKALKLPELIDPIKTLFGSVNTGIALDIKASDGSEYDGLFNTFSVNDNKLWHD